MGGVSICGQYLESASQSTFSDWFRSFKLGKGVVLLFLMELVPMDPPVPERKARRWRSKAEVKRLFSLHRILLPLKICKTVLPHCNCLKSNFEATFSPYSTISARSPFRGDLPRTPYSRCSSFRVPGRKSKSPITIDESQGVCQVMIRILPDL
jgi:hypothetical protein